MGRQLEASNQLFCDVTNFVVFNQIEGDYFEFGVYRGDSFYQNYKWLHLHFRDFQEISKDHEVEINYDKNFLKKKRFFAFDSFEGLPFSQFQYTPIHFTQGIYKASKDEFLANLKNHEVDLSVVVSVPGWFEDKLNQDTKESLSIKRAALIFIDCDLKESVIQVLDFITDIIHDGTVIVLDDYFRYKGHPQKGVQAAFNEWRNNHPFIHTAELTRCGANRVAFVCHRI